MLSELIDLLQTVDALIRPYVRPIRSEAPKAARSCTCRYVPFSITTYSTGRHEPARGTAHPRLGRLDHRGDAPKSGTGSALFAERRRDGARPGRGPDGDKRPRHDLEPRSPGRQPTRRRGLRSDRPQRRDCRGCRQFLVTALLLVQWPLRRPATIPSGEDVFPAAPSTKWRWRLWAFSEVRWKDSASWLGHQCWDGSGVWSPAWRWRRERS